MKRALVFTFSRSYNFGANLQAYALRSFIRTLGWECKTIDIRSENQKRNKVPLRKDLRGLFLNIFTLLKMDQLKEGRRKFNAFDYGPDDRLVIGSTDGDLDYDALSRAEQFADVYVVGSDQVFSPGLMSKLYFLDFDTKAAKKISYAASIGVGSIPDEKKPYFQKQLSSFSALSVREESAKNLLSDIIDNPISVHIDPVFLVSKDMWTAIEKPYGNLKENEYILAYFLYRPEGLNTYLKKLHKKTGLPVVLVDTAAFRNIYHTMQALDAGPKEFVWLVHHAKMVVTSSFHGTAFSIMYGKTFSVFNNPNTPERIDQILNKFGLNNHKADLNSMRADAIPAIDADEQRRIATVIEQEREKARAFLKGAMNDESKQPY